MEKLNYDGITSIKLDNIKADEITKGITQHILWENEDGKHTAIYKFEENSKLPFIDSHNLYDEHIYVISGVFNDGINNYEKGSYIINPKGTAHLPQSKEGCTIFVIYS